MTNLSDLSPSEFEDLSVEYLRSKGFSDVRRVGQAGDLGVDIRCKDEIGRLVVAQCKRYRAESKIGSPEIQTFFGMTARARAARGVFITASTFTDPAKRLAYELDIDLIDGSQIGEFYREKIRRQQEANRQRQIEATRQQELERQQAASLNPISARDWSQPNSQKAAAELPSPPPSLVTPTPVESLPLPRESAKEKARRIAAVGGCMFFVAIALLMLAVEVWIKIR